MKNKWIVLLLFFQLAITSEVVSQNNYLTRDTSFLLQEATFDEVLLIEVKDEHELITFRVNGEIDAGKLVVRLVDPKGWRAVGFTLSAGKGGAKGTAEDVYDAPKAGLWKVKIKAKGANGNLNLDVELN